MGPWLLEWDIRVDAHKIFEAPNSPKLSGLAEVAFLWLESSYLKTILLLLPPSSLLFPTAIIKPVIRGKLQENLLGSASLLRGKGLPCSACVCTHTEPQTVHWDTPEHHSRHTWMPWDIPEFQRKHSSICCKVLVWGEVVHIFDISSCCIPFEDVMSFQKVSGSCCNTNQAPHKNRRGTGKGCGMFGLTPS